MVECFTDWRLKKFDYNIMTLGYPKSTDSERILKLEHKGIEIRTGNPEWGAEPNKLYFVITHGGYFSMRHNVEALAMLPNLKNKRFMSTELNSSTEVEVTTSSGNIANAMLYAG